MHVGWYEVWVSYGGSDLGALSNGLRVKSVRCLGQIASYSKSNSDASESVKKERGRVSKSE